MRDTTQTYKSKLTFIGEVFIGEVEDAFSDAPSTPIGLPPVIRESFGAIARQLNAAGIHRIKYYNSRPTAKTGAIYFRVWIDVANTVTHVKGRPRNTLPKKHLNLMESVAHELRRKMLMSFRAEALGRYSEGRVVKNWEIGVFGSLRPFQYQPK